MDLKNLFEQLIAREDLNAQQMREILISCINKELSTAQIATFLALMRMKGETIAELTHAALIMLEHAHCIALGPDLLDIVGTGGDGKNTFNISTTSSLVAASAGVRIAKHGNYSVSSRSGSADLLQTAGIALELNEKQLQHCLKTAGICFIFAPQFHPALLSVRAARQELGIRTFFNLLGPLLNPARVKKQIIGVFSSQWLTPVAQLLENLGSERALVCHARDGLDEFSIAAITDVMELNHGKHHSWSLDPKDYDCYHENLDAIIVNSPEESLTLMQSVLSGTKGPARDIVLLNSAAAIYLADKAKDMESAIHKAAEAIDSGRAQEQFELLKVASHQ